MAMIKRNYNKNKKMSKKEFKVINKNAAGIDIGSSAHYVSVPQDRDKKPVQRFECYTPDLHKMAKWLKICGIDTIAMESTSVYWIPVYQMLEKYGFEVKLVNARHVKNVPGKKTDVADCQWLQKLHTFGLLSGSFRPENEIVVLRSYTRYRDTLIKETVVHINRMLKALIQMNLQLHKVISEITGVTGIKIIEAILAAQKDPVKLAKLKNNHIKKSEEEIAKALSGDYREEHLFVLKQEYEFYKIIIGKIEECDKEIEKCYEKFDNKLKNNHKPLKKQKKTNTAKDPKFNLAGHIYRITGVDLTKIDGIGAITSQTIISETGLDMSKWPTEKHFSSWLGLCPGNKKSGDKILNSKTRKVVNKASTAFRQATQSLNHSKSALGAYHRRMKIRLGTMKAVTATAHKLACLFYKLMKYGHEYVDIGLEEYEKKFKTRSINNLRRKAKYLGLALCEIKTGEVI